jgi:hypothetical protein
MTNTSIDRPGHIFDEETILHPVDTFERKLDHIVFMDKDDNDVFMLRNPQLIQNFERLHIEFDLPEKNLYESIGVTNGEFKNTFDITTKDLFMESEFGYTDLEIFLIREGNLFNFANAQSELLNHVTFSAINKDVCYSETCESIDYEEPIEEKESEEFPLWVLGVVLVVISIAVISTVVIITRKKSNEIKDYIHPDNQ